jgi:hypothetical protein
LEDVVAIMNRRLAWGVAVALVVSSAVAVMAQNQSESQGGSLAALTAEIRQLRLAVEEATRSQTQALGVYLSVQQARLVEVAARVDAAREELDARGQGIVSSAAGGGCTLDRSHFQA